MSDRPSPSTFQCPPHPEDAVLGWAGLDGLAGPSWAWTGSTGLCPSHHLGERPSQLLQAWCTPERRAEPGGGLGSSFPFGPRALLSPSPAFSSCWRALKCWGLERERQGACKSRPCGQSQAPTTEASGQGKSPFHSCHVGVTPCPPSGPKATGLGKILPSVTKLQLLILTSCCNSP